MKTSIIFLISSLAPFAFATTNFAGCTRTSALLRDSDSYTVFWWNPELKEQCIQLDCGGGRAPVKTHVPGCGGYSGTETVTPTGWPEEARPTEVSTTKEKEEPAKTTDEASAGAKTAESDAPAETEAPATTSSSSPSDATEAVVTNTSAAAAEETSDASGSAAATTESAANASGLPDADDEESGAVRVGVNFAVGITGLLALASFL